MHRESSSASQVVDSFEKRAHAQKHEILRCETSIQMKVMESMGFVHKPTALENEQTMSPEEASQAVDRWIRWGLSEQFRTLFTRTFKTIYQSFEKDAGNEAPIDEYELHRRTLALMHERESLLVEQFSKELLQVVAIKEQEETSSSS